MWSKVRTFCERFLAEAYGLKPPPFVHYVCEWCGLLMTFEASGLARCLAEPHPPTLQCPNCGLALPADLDKPRRA